MIFPAQIISDLEQKSRKSGKSGDYRIPDPENSDPAQPYFFVEVFTSLTLKAINFNTHTIKELELFNFPQAS